MQPFPRPKYKPEDAEQKKTKVLILATTLLPRLHLPPPFLTSQNFTIVDVVLLISKSSKRIGKTKEYV